MSGQVQRPVALELLEQAVNHLLELDTDTAERLGQLAGRVIAFEIVGPGLAFTLSPTAGAVQIHAAGIHTPDVTVRGRPAELLRHVAGSRSGGGGHIEIAGDVEVAQQLQQILARLDPDWEEALSRRVGDTAARKLRRGAVALRDFAREARESLGASVSEYLRYERRVLVDRPESEAFVSAVDDLRDATERLRARLQFLDRRTAGK